MKSKCTREGNKPTEASLKYPAYCKATNKSVPGVEMCVMLHNLSKIGNILLPEDLGKVIAEEVQYVQDKSPYVLAIRPHASCAQRRVCLVTLPIIRAS